MTEELLGRGDPVVRRLQQAFTGEEPTTDLAAVMQRAARYQAGEPPGVQDPPLPGLGLTQADLVAARRREPAAVARVYSAYAPALFRFFLASVGDRQLAEDLTGATFVSAIEGLPRFRGPVEGLGGWLFGVARHDLYDYRRREARSRSEPFEDNLSEPRAAVSAPELLGPEREREVLSLERRQLVAALRQLPAAQREVLMLQLVAGLTAPEVATVLGMTVGHVKALRHRGRTNLARVLGSQGLEQSQESPWSTS